MTYYCKRVSTDRHLAASSDRLDEMERAQLLCQLVAEQLLSRAAVGTWLAAGNLVECIRRWAKVKGVRPNWREGVRIGRLSEQLASDLWAIKHLRSLPRITSFFAADGMVDDDSPFVTRLRDVCVARLIAHGMVTAPH
ncbi:hypothetical protein LJR267_009212 [Paraburkholderia hospita]|uniref:hypothetical protein n=1 Tax=Paraburkholderia hospita TaxID=169430 RepID=UPI003ECD0914